MSAVSRHNVEFVLGAASISQIPRGVPQLAFAGRSNVGKSSLLNALMGRKKMVKTSATPGKTRELNFFSIDNRFHLVDLPGFGYAKFSKTTREQISRLIEGYLQSSPDLRGIVYLVDLRTSGTSLDLQMVDLLSSYGKPILLVATKGDKLKRGERDRALVAIRQKFELPQQAHWVSAHRGDGVELLWKAIEEWMVDEAR